MGFTHEVAAPSRTVTRYEYIAASRGTRRAAHRGGIAPMSSGCNAQSRIRHQQSVVRRWGSGRATARVVPAGEDLLEERIAASEPCIGIGQQAELECSHPARLRVRHQPAHANHAGPTAESLRQKRALRGSQAFPARIEVRTGSIDADFELIAAPGWCVATTVDAGSVPSKTSDDDSGH